MALWARIFLATGPADEVAQAADRHRAHLDELRAQGKLRIAGEFKHGDGFLEILDVVDRKEAEALTAASPLVEAGLGSWTLREWIER